MDKVETRLKRIEGQISGINKMYREGRDCLEIAQQLAAVRAALAQVGKMILTGEAVRCSTCREDRQKFEKMLEKIFSLS